jgi:hypothetical protein
MYLPSRGLQPALIGGTDLADALRSLSLTDLSFYEWGLTASAGSCYSVR